MKHGFTRLLAAALCVLMLLSALPTAAFAAAKKNVYRDDSEYLIEKLSNPYTYSGQADGLTPGGDRQNSYAWTIQRLTDEYGDYIYAGSNRNLLYMGFGRYTEQGYAELLKAAADLVTNGELYSDSTQLDLLQAKIFRYNLKTKAMEVFFDPVDFALDDADGRGGIFGFRSSAIFKNQLYINSVGRGRSITWRIENNDADKNEMTSVLSAAGSFMRAVTVSTDGETMYLGGTRSAEGLDVKYNFIVLETTDGEHYTTIADYNDFLEYETSEYHSDAGDVWDVIEYKGELYLTVATAKGALVFKGHKATGSETGNSHGWVWTELVGNREASLFGIGFDNELNLTVTPYIYKGDLYFLSFSNPMDAGIECLTATFKILKSEEPDMDLFFESMRSMEAFLDNESYVFRLTDGGKWQMVVGDEKICPDGMEFVAEVGAGFNDADFSCTLYNWRATTYNGRLYIGTFDSSSFLKYFTKLTNGELFEMNSTEARTQLEYLRKFISLVSKKSATSEGELSSQAAGENADIAALAAAQYLCVYGSPSSASKAMDGVDSAPSLSGVDVDTLEKLADVFEYLISNLDGETVTAVVSNILHSIKISDTGIQELRDKISALKDSPLISDKGIVNKMLEIVDGVLYLFRNVDQADIDCYTKISDTIAANDNRGFELFCTEDGINYKAVTNDGFGDEYNYGARTLIAFDGEDDPYAGIYLGTANPFYGCQLWKITERNVKIDDASFESNAFMGKFKESKHFYIGISFKSSFDFSFIPNDTNSVLYLNGTKLEGSSGSAALKFGINIISLTTKNLSGSERYTFVILCPLNFRT